MLQKTFYKLLFDFSINPTRAKQCLGDKRLSQTEKKIIEAYLLIRNNQNRRALDLMTSLNPSEFPFVEGQRQLIMGLAYNNLTYFKEAEQTLKEGLNFFKPLAVPYFDFLGNLYLFTLYSNKTNIPLMKKTLSVMEEIPETCAIQKMKLLRCQFDYLSLTDEAQAKIVLKKIEKKKSDMSEGDIASHLVCEFMFFAKCENFPMCEKVLEEMKKYRKYNLTENYNYMKTLLNHLTRNAPIYLTEKEFASIPVLYFQLKVVHALEDLNIPEARKFWDELHLLDPDMYQNNFVYVAPKCLFSLCLDKYRVMINQGKTISQISTTQTASKLERLISILSIADASISKGFLFEHVWETPAESKDDFVKLTKLVSRARNENHIDVKSRKGTYYIEKSASKKSKAV